MGYLLVIISSVLFGIFPSVQARVLASGVDPLALVVICNGVAGLTSGLVAILRGQSLRVGRRAFVHLTLAGCLGLFLTDYLLDVAYTLIPVGFATMIHFLYPTVVCVVMTLVGERLTREKLLAIVISVAGLALISGGDFGGSASGIIAALVTALAYAYYIIANDNGPMREVPVLVRTFWTNMFVIASALALSFARGGVTYPSGPVNWGLSVLVGVVFSAGLVMLNKGIGLLGASTAAFLNMIEPVTSLVVSVVAYRYAVSPMALLGCVLILGSLVLIALGDRASGAKGATTA